MKADMAAYAMASNSYLNVGRATLLSTLPESAFGGRVYQEIDLRGEYLKTAFMAKVELLSSLIGMIFWAVATLVTLWSENCRAHFMAHLAFFLTSLGAIAAGIAGTIVPYLGKAIGV